MQGAIGVALVLMGATTVLAIPVWAGFSVSRDRDHGVPRALLSGVLTLVALAATMTAIYVVFTGVYDVFPGLKPAPAPTPIEQPHDQSCGAAGMGFPC